MPVTMIQQITKSAAAHSHLIGKFIAYRQPDLPVPLQDLKNYCMKFHAGYLCPDGTFSDKAFYYDNLESVQSAVELLTDEGTP